MSYMMRNIEAKEGKSDICSRLTGILEQGEPHILFDSNRTEYKCFCVQDLFKDLFFGDRNAKPMLEKVEISKDKKEMLSFILPDEILKRIQTWKRKEGESYIVEAGDNNDYKGFFLSSVNNNKIVSLLHKIFSDMGGKVFIERVRGHIINNLSSVDLSNNIELMDYLKDVGEDTIVPCTVSLYANEAFRKLLRTGDHDSASKIIANFFVSSLLGLRSMKFSGGEKDFRKTYLLNGLGMEYIWRPDLITTSYEKLQNIQQLYDHGEYKAVYGNMSKWIEDYASFAEIEELAKAYQLIGSCMYCYPDKCFGGIGVKTSEIKSKGVSYLKKCIETGKASSDIFYLLYSYYSDPDHDETDCGNALENLKAAFTLNNANAVFEVAQLILNRSAPVNLGITPSETLRRLKNIADNAQQYTDVEVGKCLYLRGLIRKALGDNQGVEDDFIAAAQKGHEKARQEISRKARVRRLSTPVFLQEKTKRVCFVNSLSGNNLLVLNTFPSSQWSVFSTSKEIQTKMGVITVNSIDDFIPNLAYDSFGISVQQAVILFMSEDENKNLNECLMFLDQLFNIALNTSESQKWNLIDCLNIYVGANYETASMLIDASIDDMGNDIYFKVHIADAARETARQLLCDAPLFIPFLDRSKREEAANIILFGSTETNYQIIKESIACAWMGEKHPITITMLGENARHYEQRLRQECPGMFQKEHVVCIIPAFISCDLSEADFPSYIYGYDFEDSSDEPIVKALKYGNYFVVDRDNDFCSIRFAMNLRTWLLRSRGTFDRVPFIAVRCFDERNSYLAGRLTVSGRAPGNSYYSKYDLFTFGIPEQIFSYQRMIKDPRLEEVALRIHKSYSNDDERKAENDYYSYSYNADSSSCTAIGLSYRLFAGDVYFKDVHEYLDYGALYSSKLYADYLDKLEQIHDDSAELEQSRWNGYVLSRGWESASISQIQAYKDQATGFSHTHQLAKLHPFIREWDELKAENIRKILGILKSKFNYEKSPQKITLQSIKDTEKFVTKASATSYKKER